MKYKNGILITAVVGASALFAYSVHSKALENIRESTIRRADNFGNLNRRLDDNEALQVSRVIGVPGKPFSELSRKELQQYHERMDEMYGVSYDSINFVQPTGGPELWCELPSDAYRK